MRFVDALLFRFEGATRSLLHVLWASFLTLTLIGKGFAVALGLFAAGWIAGNVGLRLLARELGSAASIILSLVLTAVIIRHLWLRFTHQSRYHAW